MISMMNPFRKKLFTLFVLVTTIFAFGCNAVATIPKTNSGYSDVTPDGRGAVASVSPLATEVGLNIFKKGGNAIDAALAVAFTLGVVDSHNSGIGGGCFVIVRYADGTIEAIDGREMAPAKAHRDMFLVDGKAEASLSKTGALAIGIPGSVAALNQLQKRGGKLSFSDVILPAASIAEQGFEIDTVFANRLSRTAEKLSKFTASKKIFLSKDGNALKVGDKLVQKDLAKTYRQIAKYGPDYFYKGEFAQLTENWMKANSGIVSKEDFKNYETKIRQPIFSEFRGFKVYGFPPPSSGGIHVAQILNILDTFELEKLSEVDRYHVIVESMKLAFADRAYWLGDADFVDVPRGLISKKYAKKLANKIDLKSSTKVSTYGVPPDAKKDLFNKHTTHIATADKDGNWVAITTTLNTSYGSKVVIPQTGVLMNNQMDDFSSQPGAPNAFGLVGAEANSVEAKKRPLSSMSPTLVLDNKGLPVLTLGAAGGPTIITQVLQTLINKIALGKPLNDAMASVRVHHQWKPDRVYIDAFADDKLKSGLAKKGHEVKNWPPFGATQAIALEAGKFQAVTEPRLIERNAKAER